MPTEGLPQPQSLEERLSVAYKRLSTSAAALNEASDAMTKHISVAEGVLQNLNLGIEAWEQIRGHDDPQTGDYWNEKVGFVKVRGSWRIALRTTRGNHHIDQETVEVWPFGEAPRSLRISAVDQLPDLIEKLVAVVEKTTRKMEQKTPQVASIAKILSQVSAADAAAKKPRGR